jgi:type IV pilus assembly protein PilA
LECIYLFLKWASQLVDKKDLVMNSNQYYSRGFTLIELMIVVAIIGILSTMAVPSYQDRVIRAQVTNSLEMIGFVKEAVSATYAKTGRLPKDNQNAGIPPHDKIVGNFVSDIEVKNGTINITYGSLSNKFLSGKKLSLRPAVVAGYSKVPIAWVCGLAEIPGKMSINGSNATNLPGQFLPIDCRGR